MRLSTTSVQLVTALAAMSQPVLAFHMSPPGRLSPLQPLGTVRAAVSHSAPMLAPTTSSRRRLDSRVLVPCAEAGGSGGGDGGIRCDRREGDPWWRGDDDESADDEAVTATVKIRFLIGISILCAVGAGVSMLGPKTTLILTMTWLSLFVLGLSALLTWPFSRDGKLVSDHMRLWSRLVLLLMGCKCEARGLEKLDLKQHYVLASNHESLTDTALIYSMLPKRHLISVSKKELSYIPVFGWLMRLGGHILVDRKNHGKAMHSMSRGEDSLRKFPRSVLVFPEGTRSRDGVMKDFKKGAFVLAIQTGLPVVPVAVIGTGDVLRADQMSIENFGKVRLVIGKPISTSGLGYKDRKWLAAKVQREVKRMRDAGRKELGLEPAPR